MGLLQQFRFAMRQLVREWKAGELTVLLLAIIIAIASHTTILHFTGRVSTTMVANTKTLIGGDLVLAGHRPIAPMAIEKARELQLEYARTVSFSSVVSSNDDILLVGVKAVDEAYPLKGNLKTSLALYGKTEVSYSGPPVGEAWVEARVMQALQIEINDTITLGNSQFVVSRILAFEPDRGRNFYSFTPRVLINERDLAEAGILQPGSRVWYAQMFAGPERTIAQYREWVTPHLLPGQHIHSLDAERPGVAAALDKAQQYIGLASLVALLLASIAIATGGQHYSERHYDTSALLRCMGCSQRDILSIYLIQLGALAIVGGLLGNALGWLAQAGLLAMVSTLLPENLVPTQWETFYSGMLLAFIVLIGFTLPSILRLKSVAPQRVLNQDLTPLPTSAWLVVGSTAGLVAMMMWYYSGNLVVTLGMIGGTITLLVASTILIGLLFMLLNKLLPRFPVKIRAGIRNLLRRRRNATVQTMAFGLTIMAMLVVVFIRTELVDAWQNTIPDDAPNHFVLNIQPDDTDSYREYLQANQFRSGALYPVVRGRLTRLNGNPMTEYVSKDGQQAESLQRDLNLTWANSPPPDNEVTAGRWWSDDDDEALVSVESELAEELNIQLGDIATFFTGEQEWQARVSNIRTVTWNNFKPNFYMVFNRRALSGLPTTWINSFHIDSKDKSKLIGLVKQFPSITLLEMDAIFKQVLDIIDQVTLAIEAILGFVLAAGIVVTLAAIATSMRERMREGALLRTLGASRTLIRQSQWSEFAGMGFLSGWFGLLGAEIINAILYRWVFEIEYAPVWWAWLLIPPLCAVLIGWVGVISNRRVLKKSPILILQQ